MKNTSPQIFWYALILPILFLSQGGALPVMEVNQQAACPVYEGGKISADILRSDLVQHHCVQIRNAEVVGLFRIPPGVLSIIAEDVTFSGPIESPVDFDEEDDTEAEEFRFFRCEFHDVVSLSYMRFKRLWFNDSRFYDHAIFHFMVVDRLYMANAKFEKSVDFLGAKIGSLNMNRMRRAEPIQITWAQLEPAWLETESSLSFWSSNPEYAELQLRFWNKNFQELGQQADTLETNHLLLELRRQYYLNPSGLEWWGVFLTGLLDRHGTRPIRPFLIGVIIILLFSLYYWRKDPFIPADSKEKQPPMPKTPLGLFALLYSIDTFLPFIEITGVTKWGWQVSPNYRWVFLAERLVGFALSALLALTIGSYVL